MAEMFLNGAGLYNDFVNMYQGILPLHPRHDNIHRSLESVWDVFQSEWNPKEPKLSAMGGEQYLILVTVVYLHLPITAVGV